MRPGDYGVTVPPAIIGDRVIVGGRITEDMRTDMPAGVVRAFDAHSGALLWAWNSVPPQAEGVTADGTLPALDRQHLVGVLRRYAAQPHLHPDRQCAGRPVRHHARHRRARLLRRLRGRARCGHRQGGVALPDRAPRHLGLRRALAAGAVRFPDRERAGGRARAAHQAGLPVHPQPRDRRAAGAGRGTSRRRSSGRSRASTSRRRSRCRRTRPTCCSARSSPKRTCGASRPGTRASAATCSAPRTTRVSSARLRSRAPSPTRTTSGS